MKIRPSILAYYRSARAHQLKTYGNSGLHDHTGRDLRQFTGGGAVYGEHAIAAYWSARRTLHFLSKVRASK